MNPSSEANLSTNGINMDVHDHDLYNTPPNQVETIHEEAEYEEGVEILKEGERRNLNQDLEEEQGADDGEPYVRDEGDVDEYDTLDDIDQDQDGANPRFWMGAYTPESILARSRNTRSRFRESMRRQSLSLGGTGS